MAGQLLTIIYNQTVTKWMLWIQSLFSTHSINAWRVCVCVCAPMVVVWLTTMWLQTKWMMMTCLNYSNISPMKNCLNSLTQKLLWIKPYLLTPRCRVLLEKLTGLQLVKKFPAFHGTRRFITALTSVRHLSLSWTSPIQSIYPHPTSCRSILILSTHLRLGLPSGLLLTYLLTYLLTTRCRVHLEKLTGLQLVKKFPAFHGTQRFVFSRLLKSDERIQLLLKSDNKYRALHVQNQTADNQTRSSTFPRATIITRSRQKCFVPQKLPILFVNQEIMKTCFITH